MAQVFSPVPDDDDFWSLLLDLGSLVDAGVVAEIRKPGEPSRYGLSAAGHELAARCASPSQASLKPKPPPHLPPTVACRFAELHM